MAARVARNSRTPGDVRRRREGLGRPRGRVPRVDETQRSQTRVSV